MNELYFAPVLVAGTILFLIFLFFIVFYMLIHKRRQQQNNIEKEKLRYDYDFRLMKERLDEQERVMNQISREIHDNVAQKMDFLQMNIKALKESDSQPENLRALDNSVSIAEQIGNDLRNISYSLNGEYVTTHGLEAVINKELSYISSSQRIACTIHVEGDAESIKPDKELLIYRIAQEVFHNVVKHANASRITVRIDYAPGRFEMNIADNGVGFDRSSAKFRNGLGFRNMQHRVNLLGGSLQVEAEPGGGCSVTIGLTHTHPDADAGYH